MWRSTVPPSSTVQLGWRREQRLERDARLEPGERGPEAEVRAVAEGEMVVEAAPDVEPVGIFEVVLVAIGGPVQQEHL